MQLPVTFERPCKSRENHQHSSSASAFRALVFIMLISVTSVSGHTEIHNGENVYMPADCIQRNRLATEKLISYSEMRTLLISDPHDAPRFTQRWQARQAPEILQGHADSTMEAPLTFITDVCHCDNFLRLPYTLKYEGNEYIWTKTEYQEKQGGNSDISLFDAMRDKTPSVYEILRKLNADQLKKDPHDKTYLEHYKVYSSHKLDDPYFFEALGFHPGTKGSPCNTEYRFHEDQLREAHNDHLGLVGGVYS
ncbi:unnamed protein product [Rhizoctonia solani]|uniref:Uncharacterized protein n=1 Tax=Rhizoctonia solani TaxID=456999 RepID=A0A8H3DKA6_9AGAM|nr:unnamed protein product [Rhizoctonia solani]